ncbi:MAG: AmmeMemoRadiSam system protein B [Candidatus Woesearchaeota archaeon]|jgi:hypothetical protein
MKVRNPAVAGKFYPADRQSLSVLVEKLLKSKKINEKISKLDNIHGLIVPHAGYEFSGLIAAAGYEKILGKQFHRVVILCPNHSIFLNKIAIDGNESWLTPLGPVLLDKDAISKLNYEIFISSSTSHQLEHAIEVQIPFIQKILPQFKIVPLIVGLLDEKAIELAANNLIKLAGPETLFIISTDLSHFLTLHEAEKEDAKTINNIATLNYTGKLNACGANSLKILELMCKQKKWTPKLIEYTNSGRITNDKSKVVGYASFWF